MTMNVFDLLIAFLSIAVAFAGFTGVVSLIDRKAARVSVHIVSYRVRALNVAVLIVIALSILPFLLTAFALPGLSVWRICCAVFAIVGVIYLFWIIWVRTALRGEQLEGWSNTQFNIHVPSGFLSVAAAIFGASGTFNAMGVYLVGLFFFTMGIASLFFRLVLMLDDSKRNRDENTGSTVVRLKAGSKNALKRVGEIVGAPFRHVKR